MPKYVGMCVGVGSNTEMELIDPHQGTGYNALLIAYFTSVNIIIRCIVIT